MPSPPKVTAEMHDYILKELAKPSAERPSLRAIGRALGIEFGTVRKWSQRPLTYVPDNASEPGAPPASSTEEFIALLRKLLKKQPMSVAELADATDRSPKTIHAMISEMNKMGVMLVETVDGRYDLALSAALEPGKHAVKGTGDDWTHHFGITTDNHLCNRQSRLDVLNAAYDHFERVGITETFNCGNWIDGIFKFNKNEIITRPTMDAQLDYMIDNWPVRKGIVTKYIAGDDHEGWFQQREGIEIGRYLMLRAQEQGRHDLQYLGYAECDIELKYGKGSAPARIVHPGGGSAYAISYTDQKRVESYQGGEKPRVEFVGHYHKFNVGYPREVHTVQAGCTCDQTLFMRKKRLQAHVGFVEVKIRQEKDTGIITRFATEWFPFFDRAFYEHRY